MKISQVIAVLAVLGLALVARGGTIALRSAAKIDSPRAVTLADVAELTGDDAVAAGAVVVEPDVAAAARGRTWAEVTIEQVERALAEAGVATGRLAISGSRCYVRFGAVPPEPKADKRAAKADDGPKQIDFSGPDTVRVRVGTVLTRLFGVSADAIRVKFEPGDEDVLALPVEGRKVAIEPMTSASTTRALVGIRVYEGETLAVNKTIACGIELRRRVIVVSKDVARGRTVSDDLLAEEDRWLEPGGAALVTARDQVVGCEALTRLEAGVPLREHDAAPAVIIKRGDIVDVLCLSGGLEIKARARAMSDGRRGERIELRMEGSKKSFVGRADGPSRVVVALDGVDKLAAETKAEGKETP